MHMRRGAESERKFYFLTEQKELKLVNTNNWDFREDTRMEKVK